MRRSLRLADELGCGETVFEIARIKRGPHARSRYLAGAGTKNEPSSEKTVEIPQPHGCRDACPALVQSKQGALTCPVARESHQFRSS